MPPSCSADDAVITTDRATVVLQALFARSAAFCLPEVSEPAAGSTLSACTSAACANTPNTCAGALSPPTISFDPSTATFSATADITVTGAATLPPLSCSTLQISAPGTTFSGTLQATLDPSDNPVGVQYSVANLVVNADSIAVSGCGAVVDSALSIAVGLIKTSLEQSVATLLSQQTFSAPCASTSASAGSTGE